MRLLNAKEATKIRDRLHFLISKADAGMVSAEDIHEIGLLKRKLYFNK